MASEEAVSQHVQQQALQRGLPKKRRVDAEWSSYLTLPPTLRQRVKDYEAVAKQREGLEDENAEGAMISGVVNLNQTATYMPCVNKHIPALLTQSRLWSLRARREILPWEHLAFMGYVVQEAPGSALAPYELEASCKQALASMTDRDLRRLTGNAFHLSSIGSSLAFFLACAEPSA